MQAMYDYKRSAVQLFSLGFLTLFLELVLIRYLAGSIWNLGYFPNLVLIAVFIGMGIGFVFHERVKESWSPFVHSFSACLLFLLINFVVFFQPSIPGFSSAGGTIGGELFFTSIPQGTNTSLLSFLLWFIFLVLIFTAISQRTAKVFAQFKPLTAYTLDIAGSCAGIVAFMLCSLFLIPAWVWFIFVLLLYVVTLYNDKTEGKIWMLVSLIFVITLVSFQDGKLSPTSMYTDILATKWSPYQKVEYTADDVLLVNGVGHQELYSPEEIREYYYKDIYDDRKERGLPPYERILILGSGGGNDVLAALEHGATEIDAVEIDPVILDMGRTYHKGKPYSDPRVTMHVDDGRAFMTRADKKYDLIIFALTDSLVKISPVTQLRLENYLFTNEAIMQAHSLLSDDGDLLFYNFYRRPWLVEKMYKMVFEATGIYPRTISVLNDMVVFAAGKHNSSIPEGVSSIETPTDDWPFLYMQKRQLPFFYYLAMILVSGIVLALLGALQWQERRTVEGESRVPLSLKVAFLSMGVAFLLLETKSIIQFSLLFGTTWLNNSLVFLAVLLLVLVANWTALLLKKSHLTVCFVLLLASGLITLFYPLSHLLAIESEFLRFCIASLMTFLPLFFANLIFSVSFRDMKLAEYIFGWNLIGATLGGIIEYTSVLTGYNALTWIVLLCYTITFFALKRAAHKSTSQ